MNDIDIILSVLPRVTIPAGKIICRCRVHKDFNSLFYKKTDLYDPDGTYPCLGRANFDRQVVFYGSVHDDQEGAALPRITNLYEVSEFARDNASSGREAITYSGWKVNTPLSVVAIPSFENLPKSTSLSRKVDSLWAIIANRFDQALVDRVADLSSYFTAEDNGNGSVHYYTASFANEIWNNHKEIDGIVYPSVRLQGDGINVVLRTDVPQEKLSLEDATVCHLFKSGREAKMLNRWKSRGHIFNHISYGPHDTYDVAEYRRTKKEYTLKELNQLP